MTYLWRLLFEKYAIEISGLSPARREHIFVFPRIEAIKYARFLCGEHFLDYLLRRWKKRSPTFTSAQPKCELE